MACLYSVMLPWQQNTRQLKYQNTEVYLFILCYANFGDPGINGFGKIENATQVSKTVFSHLKTGLNLVGQIRGPWQLTNKFPGKVKVST